MTQIRVGAIYAPLACVALALALYSCNEPPARQQPTPLPPTPAIVAVTSVPATPTPQPSPIPAAPTPPKQPQPSAPTPTPKVPLIFVQAPDSVPLPDDVSFTQITAGKHHACGLQNDGTALCGGSNISGSLNFPDGLAFSQISAGLNFNCGLRVDRAIACWGENNAGQTSPPNGRFDEVASGHSHACALADGALICWGADFPDGAETIQELPPLSAIQAGAGFTCGLTPNADMACWNNNRRELAITPGPFTKLAAGLHHACAIKSDSSVFCGEEDHAQTSHRSQPPPTKFVQIAGGWSHTCGITEISDIECWGSGVPGAPGERLSAPEGKFTAISIGWRNSCALRPNGHAVCWHQHANEPLYLRESNQPASSDQLSYTVQLSEAFGGIEFEQPVELFPLPDDGLAIVERNGLIAAYSDEPNAAPPKTMLDLTDKTICCDDESGMLSAALDPQFEKFPFLYVYYRVMSRHAYGDNMPGLASRLARFRVKNGQALRDSELTILEVPQARKWHYGGAIRFGADGMLYLSIGDNLSAEKAQSIDTLLGKIVRIDVRGATPEQPYRAPPDNPFVHDPEALPEIWAYGLRNPWRMDFAPDGRLFVADAGDRNQEEISFAEAGANLGWPLCEGNACREGVEADAAGLTAPIFTYGREKGCAIIGGVTMPQLNNGFLFGDFCSKRVWLLEQDEQEGWQTRTLAQTEGQILSFGIDADGTVYVLTRRNPIMRLQIEGE